MALFVIAVLMLGFEIGLLVAEVLGDQRPTWLSVNSVLATFWLVMAVLLEIVIRDAHALA